MQSDQTMTYLERALLHLDLIGETSAAEEMRLHAHFANLFLQLERQCREQEAASALQTTDAVPLQPGAVSKRDIPRWGDGGLRLLA